MSQRKATPLTWFTCPLCGKRTYVSRKAARAVAHRPGMNGHVHAYRCGNGWHVGHLPVGIVAGRESRSDVFGHPDGAA